MRYLLLLAPVVLLAGPPRYARVGDFEGQVETQARASDDWIAAERNAPLPEAARVRTGAASRIEIELDEGSVVRLGPNSQVELSDYARLSTGQRVTLLSFERGLAYITSRPEGKDALELAIPGAQVSFTRGARVRLQLEEQWSAIAILRGAARFSSPAADMEIREGQTTRVEPANAARFFFYREVLPLDFDKWSAERDDALASSTSAAHVIQRYGLADLDHAGEWILTEDLGAIWRPKVGDDWLPFQKGRWRWHDGLGYTWISDEPWGWLPYHYGRWTRLDNLGWVWVASHNGVFKPGEVYWVRGKSFLGWGPLAPGEQWDPADPVNPMPQQFVNANTTYAALLPGASSIDPAGFTDRPKDPLKGVDLMAAPSSPPFLASRLDAMRPLVNAASLRVKPVVEGVTIETAAVAPPPRPRPAPAPAPAPVVLVTQAPPQPPADPEVVVVPVPVPAGIVFVDPHAGQQRHAPKPAAPTPPPVVPVVQSGRHDRPPRTPGSRKFKSPAESALAATVVQDLDARAFPKALTDLDAWTARFRDTDFADDRLYYYMLAYNGLNQPLKVLDTGSPLVARPVTAAFDDPMQQLSVVYLAAVSFERVARPTRDQSTVARAAALELLAILPSCFTPERRPQAMTAADWAKSRSDLESLGHEIIARTKP